MGYDLSQRLSSLRAQAETETEGWLTYGGVFVKAAFLLGFLAFFISQLRIPDATETAPAASPYSSWQRTTKQLVEERRDYLLDSVFGDTRAQLYVRFANNIIELFGVGEPSTLSDNGKILDLEAWGTWLAEANAGLILRLVFIIFACTHLWIVGIGLGFVVYKYFLLPVKTKDILGVLDKGRGPFYSGIYGPLRPNRSASGTDLSCPGLACPKLASRTEGSKHVLSAILRKYGANNETNMGLTRIILAYRDYPTVVDEERHVEEETEENVAALPTSSFRTNEEGTIEASAKHCLEAVLLAHKVLGEHYLNKATKGAKEGDVAESDYTTHLAAISQRAQKLPPLAQRLVLSLTPSRGRALAQVPAQAVASAYLSTEAGKCLVYRREGTAFFPVSRFPHLQARAVLHSLVSYHTEYSGDLRLTIRQAIICSRRHGDFGRAFLPMQMSMASRALRDWLEVLFSAPKRRDSFSHLVELDAHLEEISLSFRKEFIKRLIATGMVERVGSAAPEIAPLRKRIWKGFAYKSVVLVPLKDLVNIALHGVNPARLDRVSELIQHTKKLQSSLSISARLPGFKRQAEEAGKSALESGGVTRALAEAQQDSPLLAGWLIMRRMLTRYNWLSTRVGDSAVPVDGLIQAIVLDRTVGERPDVLALDALVPLRQRRFKELLGPKWESLYYANNPGTNDVDIYEVMEEFEEGRTAIQEQVKKGLFDKQVKSGARG